MVDAIDPIKAALKESGNAERILKPTGSAIIKDADQASRTIPFLVSTPQVDRMGDIVVPTGARLESYLANPVVLWAHSRSGLPIGVGSNVRADATGVRMDKKFATKDEHELADSVYRMLLAGYLRAASIGFMPIKWAWAEDRGAWAVDYLEWELLESSVVPVPANPGALAGAKSAGIDVAPVAEWASQILDSLPVDDPHKRKLYEAAYKHATEHPIYHFAKAQTQLQEAPQVVTIIRR